MASLVDRGARDHYRDADLYDHEYRRRRGDVRFYQRLASRVLGGPGRILELGAGSGRVTAALLRDGHDVTAVDHAPEMLARLEARVARLGAAARARFHPVRADIREVRVPGRFPLVLAGFNVLEHLYTRVEVAACLRRVAAQLAPGGTFAFDVQLPDLLWLSRDPERRWARTRFKHPRTGEPLLYSTNHDYDPIAQIAFIRIYYDPDPSRPHRRRSRPRVVHLSQRKFFPAELEALVAAGGFRVVERYGDFDGGPLVGGSESQILVCQKAKRFKRLG